jgi:hypothetical protein
MAHDGSLASKVEEWIVGRIQTIAAFAGQIHNVEVWPGSQAADGEQIIAEMLSYQMPHAFVLFEGDRAVELEEGQQDYEPTYAIFIVQQVLRPAASRTGEAGPPVVYGTNGIRDLVRNALHDQIAGQTANGFFAARCAFKGAQVVFQRNNAFIVRAEVVVREEPAAA